MQKALDPADTDVIVREIKTIIAQSTTGVFDLVGGKYRMEVMYGGSQIAPLDFAAAARANEWLNRVPFRVGDIRGLDRGAHPPAGRYVARGVSVASDELDSALQRLCDAAISKGGQLRTGSPGIITAEFGMPLTDEQARWDRLQKALSYHISPRFVRHAEISAVAFLFPTDVRRSSVDRRQGGKPPCPFDGGVPHSWTFSSIQVGSAVVTAMSARVPPGCTLTTIGMTVTEHNGGPQMTGGSAGAIGGSGGGGGEMGAACETPGTSTVAKAAVDTMTSVTPLRMFIIAEM